MSQKLLKLPERVMLGQIHLLYSLFNKCIIKIKKNGKEFFKNILRGLEIIHTLEKSNSFIQILTERFYFLFIIKINSL